MILEADVQACAKGPLSLHPEVQIHVIGHDDHVFPGGREVDVENHVNVVEDISEGHVKRRGITLDGHVATQAGKPEVHGGELELPLVREFLLRIS